MGPNGARSSLSVASETSGMPVILPKTADLRLDGLQSAWFVDYIDSSHSDRVGMRLSIINIGSSKPGRRPRSWPDGLWQEEMMRRRRKPDLMMLLFVAIGLGVVVSGYAFDLGNQDRVVEASAQFTR